jgi:transposase-like protein
MSHLSAPHFHNEEAAYVYVEARVWPHGPVCPHCGGFDRIGKMGGKSTRIGTYKCYQCRKPFTVKSAPSSRRATSRCTTGFRLCT